MPLPLIPIAMALAQIAPSLMKFFGVGDQSVAVAEKAVGIAQTITGTSTPEAALAALQADQKAQDEFRMAVLQREGELEDAYLKDKQDARARDVLIVQAKGKNLRGDVLAYSAIGALIATIVALFLVSNIPDSSEKLLYSLLGALIMIVKDVYSFEFGSSKDSQRNAQAVADMLKQG